MNDDGIVVMTQDEMRERIARFDEQTPDKNLMIMHNHGLLSCGRSAGEAFWFMYYLEASCKIQVDVLSAGTEYLLPEESAVQGLRAYGKPQEPPRGSREWPGLLRSLDKVDSSFRQ